MLEVNLTVFSGLNCEVHLIYFLRCKLRSVQGLAHRRALLMKTNRELLFYHRAFLGWHSRNSCRRWILGLWEVTLTHFQVLYLKGPLLDPQQPGGKPFIMVGSPPFFWWRIPEVFIPGLIRQPVIREILALGRLFFEERENRSPWRDINLWVRLVT